MFSFKKLFIITLTFFTILFSANAEITCEMDDEGIYITFDSNRFLEVYDVDQKGAEEMLSKPFSFADLKNNVTPKTVIWYNIDNYLIGFKKFKVTATGIQGEAFASAQDYYATAWNTSAYSEVIFPKFKIVENGDIISGKANVLKKLDSEKITSKFAINKNCVLTLPEAEMIFDGQEYVMYCKNAYITAKGYKTPYIYIPYGEVTIDSSFQLEPKTYDFNKMSFKADENTLININGIRTQIKYDEELDIDVLDLYFSGSYVLSDKKNNFELKVESQNYDIPLTIVNDHFKLAVKETDEDLVYKYKLHGYEYECYMPDTSDCDEESTIMTFNCGYIKIQDKLVPVDRIKFDPALYSSDMAPYCYYEYAGIADYEVYLSLFKENDFLARIVKYTGTGETFAAEGLLSLEENYYNTSKVYLYNVVFLPDGTFQKELADANAYSFNLGEIRVLPNGYCSMDTKQLSYFNQIEIIFPQNLHLGSIPAEILHYKNGSFTVSDYERVCNIFPSITTTTDLLEITKDSVKVVGSCWLPDWIPISSLINGRFYLKTLEIGFDGSIKNLEISSQPGDIQITDGNTVHKVHIDGFSLDFRNGSWYVIAENPAIIENNNVYPLDELLWNLETSN